MGVTGNDQAKPNFFILGAPKCGTTSLAAWLSEHPAAFISTPKEPRFFNTDLDLPARPTSVAEYEALFTAGSGSAAIGEATTGYLSSAVALGRILDFAPQARFIVSLRPPVELFLSLHKQRLKEGYENQLSPVQAWHLRDIRQEGSNIPLACPDPKLLDYERFCRIGTQVSHLLDRVEASRVHIVFLERMRTDPAGVYLDVCNFLGLPPHNLADYSQENPARIPRSLAAAGPLRLMGRVARKLGLPRLGMLTRLNQLNNVRMPADLPMYPGFREELSDYFESEVRLLESMLQRNLAHWRSSGK